MDKEQNGADDSRLKLGTALAKFQATLDPALKKNENPFYGGKYADLNSIIEATKEPKAKSGIAFSVVPDVIVEKLKATKTTTYPDGRVETVEKETLGTIEIVKGILMVGGVWLEGKSIVKTGAKGPDDPQAQLAGQTYARRGMQNAMLNIPVKAGDKAAEADADDDGESIIGEKEKAKRGKAKPASPKRPVMNRTEGDLGI